MNKLTKWMPDIDGGYYKAVEVDKAIKSLEQQNELLRGAIREHKETLLTADWDSEDERDTVLANNDEKLHSVLEQEK